MELSSALRLTKRGGSSIEFSAVGETSFKKRSPRRKALPNIRHVFAGHARIAMKAKIIITPKKAVLDPQGKTVQSALEHMGYAGVAGVHVGKYVEIDLAPGTDRVAAEKALDEACHRFLSNPVIEDYKLEIE